jgi:WD40 repeat protein
MREPFQSPATPVIPDHHLLRCIGHGSYGEIWLAKNILETYRAVKIVYRAKFETDRPYEREFIGIQESEPISRSHPGLVDILQIGRNDEAGYFYYVMELADDEAGGSTFDPDSYSAKTLSKELHAHGRLPAAESLQLGQNLAAALAHMHQHGLVHRDIKPSNIIFVNGEPKLADIGLVALLTEARTYVGTEGYIPPEGPGSIQADIYSLGMVLYEVSTGQDRQLFPELPGNLPHFSDSELVVELNEVVVKACANLPTARYARADDFRSDLQMLAGGRSVRRLRFVERQLRRVRRLAIVASVLAIAAIIFGSIVTALRERERTLIAHNYLTGSTRLMEEGNLHGALPLLAEALRLQKGDSSTLDTHRTRIGTVLQQAPKLLQFWQTESGLMDAHFSPDGTQLLLAGGKRAWLVDIETGATGMVFLAAQPIQTATFSPDGQRVVLAHGHFLSVRDVSTGSNCFTVRVHGAMNTAEFSPDGEMILAACGANCAHILNAIDGTMNGEELRGHTGPVMQAAFSADGSRIVTVAQDATARIWDVKTRQTLRTLQHAEPNYRLRRPPWVLSGAFSPDGQRVVTTSWDRNIRVWNVKDGSVSLPPMDHRSSVRRAHFSPDGRYIISAGYDQMVRIWDALTGLSTGGTINLRSSAMQAEFDADASRVVTVGFGGEVKVWNVIPTAPVFVGPGIVSGNGERYVTFSSNTFQRWSARDDSSIGSAEVAPDAIIRPLCDWKGERVVIQTVDLDNDSRLGHVFDGEARRTNSFSAPAGRWRLSDSGTKLITATEHEIFLWEVESGALLWQSVNSPVAIGRAVFSPDEGTIAVAAEKTVYLLDARTSKVSAKPLELEQNVRELVFSRDSSRLVTATSDSGFNPGAAQLWNVRSGRRIGSPMPHADGLSEARFSHNGQLVATAGEDNRARVWNAASGAPITEPISLLLPVLSVEFSADDRWFITTTWFGVQVWNTRTGHAVTPPFTDVSILERAGFCAGGQRIWVESRRGLLFWDLPRQTKEPDELIALADHLGVTVPSSVQWNRDAFTLAKLRERCAAERARLQANLQPWQREQARLSEALPDWFAAQFYLRRLVQRNPDDAALRDRLAAAQKQYEISIAPPPGVTLEPLR